MMKHKLFAVCMAVACSLNLSAKSFVTEKDGHPWMIFNLSEVSQIRQNTQAFSWTRDLYQRMLLDSRDIMKAGFVPFVLEEKGKYSFGTAGRALSAMTLNLLFTGYLEENISYINQAKKIMFSAIRNTMPGEFGKDKANSKAVRQRTVEQMKKGIPQKWRGHLQNGDAAYAMAMAYDLLYPFLNQKEIGEYQQELREMADWLCYSYKGEFSHLTSTAMGCNHTSVHYGPLGLIALALGQDEPHYSDWLSTSKKYIKKYIEVCADKDGYVLEGLGYGAYGLSGTYPLAHALKRVQGSAHEDWFAQYRDPYFKKQADQLVWKVLPNEDVLVFNDSRNKTPNSMLAANALIYHNPVQLWSWLKSEHYFSRHQFAPLEYVEPYGRFYLFMHRPFEPVAPSAQTEHLSKWFEGGRVFMRSAWNDSQAAMVGFTSGRDIGYAHNHDDENNVTFFALGTDFLFDAEYEARFSYCHSIPSIGGLEQSRDMKLSVLNTSGTEGKIQQFQERPYGAFVRGEAADPSTCQAYNPQVVKTFNRKVLFVRQAATHPYLVFRDDLQLKSGDAVDYTARYITNRLNTIQPDHEYNGLTISGGKMGGKALLLVFSGDRQVAMSEDRLEGKLIADYGKWKRPMTDYFKRMSGQVHAVNPRFVTLVLPYMDRSELPKVKVEEQGDKIICRLTYKSATDTLVLSSSDITLQR